MKFRSKESPPQANHLQMSSMIDIVFLLLVFFIMTFKIVAQEGDLQLLAPQSRRPETRTVIDPPQKLLVTLRADNNGELIGIRVADQSFANLRDLNGFMIDLVDGASRESLPLDVTVECDYELKYEHAIRAVEAISGFRTVDGELVMLNHRVRFAPPRK